MTAYVDPMRPVRVVMGKRIFRQACHLLADTDEELERIREEIGLKHRWKHNDHYDILSPRLRQKAIDLGAMQVTTRQIVEVLTKTGAVDCNRMYHHNEHGAPLRGSK
jgi:hypothetical protein